MTGQDAVNIAQSFNDRLDIGGIVLTKMDGDARGGAALSIKAVTGKPVKFVGVGEKLKDLEPFHPDRMSSRILGMGDVLTLIEKAQNMVDEKKAVELEKKLKKKSVFPGRFPGPDGSDSKNGIHQGSSQMIPGVANNKQFKKLEVDEREFVRIEAIINSMTPQERDRHTIINGSRRKRIAKGSGTQFRM